MTNHHRPLAYRFSLPFLLVTALLAALVTFHGLLTVRYHGDEGAYINDSSWFDQWLRLNFTALRQSSDQKLLEAPVGPLLVGMSRHVAGIELTQTYSWAYDFPGDQAISRSVAPSAPMLLAGRLPMALLTFGTLLLLAALILREFGYLASACVTALLLLNQGLMDALRQVLTESPLLFFSVVGLILCARGAVALRRAGSACRASPLRDTIVSLALAGIAVGLSAASKHNGATALAACAVLLFIAGFAQPVKVGGLIALLGAAALGIFLLLNPFTWANPFQSLGDIIAQRNQMSAGQQQMQPANALTSLDARLLAGTGRTFTQDASLGCDLRDYGLVVLDARDGTYRWQKPASSTALAIPLAGSFLCDSAWPWSREFRPITLLNLALCALGISMCVAVAIHPRGKAGNPATRRILNPWPALSLLMWGLALVLPVVLLAPLNWSRYYVLAVFFTSIWIGIGVSAAVRSVARLILRRQ